MASKSSKRRRKRRQVHQGTLPEDAANGVAEGDPKPQPARTAPKRVTTAPASRPRRGERSADEERPPAPWGNFPLVEIAVLVGLVMVILGFFFIEGERGVIFVGTGLVLASIGGLEVAIREHFAGYRSHTLILSGVPAAIVLAVLFYAGPDSLPPAARAAIAAAVFSLAALLLVRLFRNRSGGRSFRFSTFRGGG